MGSLFREVGQYLIGEFADNEIIVEVGSDRWEGSTAYFADLANTHNTRMITVDIDPEAYHRVIKTVNKSHLERLEFVCADASDWCCRFDQYGKQIKVLYLDNFDWDWESSTPSEEIQKQRTWYRKMGIEMTNLNCQKTHLVQMVNLLPSMCLKSVVCIDDTYEHNDVYIGKGGAVVPYLMINGYQILKSGDYGVILGRGIRNNIV
jgi:hypothetical protein